MKKLFVSFIIAIISVVCLTVDGYCFSFFGWSLFGNKNIKELEIQSIYEEDKEGEEFDYLNDQNKQVEDALREGHSGVESTLTKQYYSTLNSINKFRSKIADNNIPDEDWQELYVSIWGDFEESKSEINKINDIVTNIVNESNLFYTKKIKEVKNLLNESGNLLNECIASNNKVITLLKGGFYVSSFIIVGLGLCITYKDNVINNLIRQRENILNRIIDINRIVETLTFLLGNQNRFLLENQNRQGITNQPVANMVR